MRNPVVARKEGEAAAFQTRRERALDAGDLRGERFHDPERADRLGLRIDGAPDRAVERGRDRRKIEHSLPPGSTSRLPRHRKEEPPELPRRRGRTVGPVRDLSGHEEGA